MHIVHIITCLDVGGAETMLKRLVSTEMPDEFQTVISLTSLGEIGEELKRSGVRVIALNLGKNPLQLIQKLLKLRGILKELAPDIVQTWMYHADLVGGIAARLAGIRHVVWGIRGTYPPIGRPLTYLVMKLCAGLSRWLPERILCVAKSAKISHSAYGYLDDKMHVIPNGLDFREFSTIRTDYLKGLLNLQVPAVFLGCVGRYHPDKAQELLVNAFLQIASLHPELHLVLIGRGCDAENGMLNDLIYGHAAADRVHLLGQRRDIAQCLSGMDMYCMPSRTEGFPNGLAEAMAAGLPVLATDAGDSRQLVADYGVIVERNNLTELKNGLSLLVGLSEKERATLGKKAAEHVRRHYSIDSIRREYSVFYHDLMEV